MENKPSSSLMMIARSYLHLGVRILWGMLFAVLLLKGLTGDGEGAGLGMLIAAAVWCSLKAIGEAAEAVAVLYLLLSGKMTEDDSGASDDK